MWTYLLNSSSGLAVWEWAEGERGSGFRLLLKACRCFTSSLTTSTCSSVGLKDSWVQSKARDQCHVLRVQREGREVRSEPKTQQLLSSSWGAHCAATDLRQACSLGQAAPTSAKACLGNSSMTDSVPVRDSSSALAASTSGQQ